MHFRLSRQNNWVAIDFWRCYVLHLLYLDLTRKCWLLSFKTIHWSNAFMSPFCWSPINYIRMNSKIYNNKTTFKFDQFVDIYECRFCRSCLSWIDILIKFRAWKCTQKFVCKWNGTLFYLGHWNVIADWYSIISAFSIFAFGLKRAH